MFIPTPTEPAPYYPPTTVKGAEDKTKHYITDKHLARSKPTTCHYAALTSSPATATSAVLNRTSIFAPCTIALDGAAQPDIPDTISQASTVGSYYAATALFLVIATTAVHTVHTCTPSCTDTTLSATKRPTIS